MHLKFGDHLLNKGEYLALANMPSLKCFKISGLYYSLRSEEILLPLGLNCKNLECFELDVDRFDDFQFDVNAFDNFFEKRQNTLKRLRIMRFYDSFKENLFHKMNLCQNIEQLVLQGRFMSDESFYGISQLRGLRTLNIGNVPRKILEIADWPNLERLWINALYYSDSEDYREDKFNDACIEKLIYNSSKLNSCLLAK